jgi:uncharacterized protein
MSVANAWGKQSMKLASSLLTAACLLFPLAAHAVSFDCRKAHSPTEQLICNDPELSAADDQLGALYQNVQSVTKNRRALRTERDQDWQWRETNCSDKKCLLTWYWNREEELTRQLAQLSKDDSGKSSTDDDGAKNPPPQSTPFPKQSLMRAVAWQPPRECTPASTGQTAMLACNAAITEHDPMKPASAGAADWFCGVAVAQ